MTAQIICLFLCIISFREFGIHRFSPILKVWGEEEGVNGFSVNNVLYARTSLKKSSREETYLICNN